MYENLIKRIIDIGLSFVAFLFLSPLFLIIAILIKCDSKGSVFFVQLRRGKNGKLFNMYKFRSMVTNAEIMGTGLFNYDNDLRVTKVGAFLRKTSLDELPQLFNIIVGDMSIVGPRPSVSYELGDYDTLNATYKKRFTVKPGLTGLAQISGRNEIPWDEKVILDNEYVDLLKTKGFSTDVRIIFETVVVVLRHNDITEAKICGTTNEEESARLAQEEIIRRAHEQEKKQDNEDKERRKTNLAKR